MKRKGNSKIKALSLILILIFVIFGLVAALVSGISSLSEAVLFPSWAYLVIALALILVGAYMAHSHKRNQNS